MSNDFNVSHIPFRFFCDRLVSNNIANNLIIESSSNNIELNSNNRNFIFNNNAIFNYGINLQGLDVSNIQSITAKSLNVNTLFLKNKGRSLTSIEDYGSIDDGYIRATIIANDISGRSSAYFTYIDVSGGDSSFNNSAYIKNLLTVNGSTTISNDLFVNGTSFVTLYNAINNYIINNRQQLVTAKVLTNDLSATNISISNELVVRKTSFINDLSINGELLNNVLKVPSIFTIDPSGHGNNSGTLIVNGDLMVYGNTTIIASSIFEISDVAISVASNLINKIELSGNGAGLNISNVASLKYDGSTWNFVGGQLSVENKRVALDGSFIDFRSFSEASLNSLNNYFDLSYGQLKTNNDNSYNAIYSRSQIDNSFMLITQSSFDISLLRSYVDNSFVTKLTFDGSFSALKTHLDASYIIKSTSTNLNIIDSSLNFLNRKLDLSYVTNSVFDGSFNKLKEQIEISFASVSLTSLDTSSISVETINTKHYSQKFNNILWNQIGLDISSGPPLTNNNKKVAISNDGKVVALSSSSHSDISKGRIYVYELSYNQAPYSWNQLGLSSEIIVGQSNDDQFGWDLALSSNGRVVAGSSITNDASGINSGQVRVYELSNNTNRWTQKGFAINGQRVGSESGYSISLAGNGNRIAIGAWKDNSNGTNAGAVRVYDFSATINDWRQQGQTISGSLGSFEGYSTALSLDGQTLASASILEASRNIIGIGGTVSTSGGYIIHSFTAVGSYAFVPALSGNVEVLIVGGGGGGGSTGNNGSSGGGGAGGVVYIPSTNVILGTSYEVVVGDGGASGANGQNSSAFTAIAAGGGRGGLPYPTNGDGSGRNGGSGGGAGGGNITNIGGISSGNSPGTNSNAIIHGNNGGSMTSNLTDANRAAGGGGAGTKGFDTDTNSTADGGQFGFSSGGDGIMYNILGPSYYWGGGGGGAGRFSIGGWGGRGGGGGGGGSQGSNSGGPGGGSALTSGGAGNVVGSGAVADRGGGNGGANTGGGGGGGSYNNIGGRGGSGIVIIRYLVPNISRGLVKTFTISGNTWTSKGNITGYDISFGRAIKLSGNGNTIVIGAPGYTNSNEYKITPIYEYNSSVMNWQAHRTNALTVFGRDLAVILDASQNAQVNALRNGTITYLGGRRKTTSVNATGKTAVDWEWVTGDVWNYTAFPSNQPDYTNETVIHMYFSDGGWNDIGLSNSYTAVYMYYILQPLNTGRAYVYGHQGGTTWTQLGQTIQGISGGDEFGSSVAISNDGSIISIGSDTNSSNIGHVRVFAYANNYWNQVSASISGKTTTSRAGIHALSGDGTTLIQSNNTYNSVYGINKTLAVNSPMTTISGNLIVMGNISVNSLDISTNHVYSSNGYSYKMFNSDISSAIMKEYYSDVTSSRHLKVQIRGDGNITNRNNSYRALSDSRLKENIVTSGPKLDDLLKVRVVDYTMKGSSNNKYIGVLAQELEGHFPNLVTELEPSPKDIEEGRTLKYKAVNYSSFDAILIKSLQEQNAMLKNITRRIETLEEALEE